MIKSLIISTLCLAICLAPASAGAPAIGTQFPADFKERAFEHVDRLAALGPRSPGAEGEEGAIRYIVQQFEEIGLEVRLEKFEYETFKIERFDFTVCGEDFKPESIGFNPYDEQYNFDGEPIFVGPDAAGSDLSRLDLKNRIVVTTSPVDFFNLMFQSPLLVVYVSNSDFASMSGKSCTSCNLTVKGAIEKVASANIVAELVSRTSNQKEIIISAHWDSYRDSPGADDNGSGVGVLLELARFFSTFEGEIDGTIKFISFGAEELGIVGSRAYVNTHHDDLQNCTLVFNIDQVGGPNGPVVEMSGGVQGIPERKGQTQFPARSRNRTFDSLDGRWRIIDPELIKTFMVSNRPEWLIETIETSAEQLGLEITPRGNMGADSQSFTQAGIVATSIGTSGNRHHSPEDVCAQIDKNSLEIAGKIVANVVLMSFRDGLKTD